MSSNGIDKRYARIEILPDWIFYIELFPIGLPDISHTVDSRGDRSVRHAADGRAEVEQCQANALSDDHGKP